MAHRARTDKSPLGEEDYMDLQSKRVAVLVEQQYQEMEVWYPVYRLREAGCKVVLVGPEGGLAPDELAALESAPRLRLGPHVLRSSTAPAAAVAVLSAEAARLLPE